jgi:hypothetical protein
MSRKDRVRAGRGEAIQALLEAGDHAGARAEARRVLADEAAATAPEERAAAVATLRSLRPEPGAVALGLGGALLAVGVALWTVLGGR